MVMKAPTETEAFTLKLSSGDGSEVEVTVEYPKGKALLGLQAIDVIAKDRDKYIMTVMQGLQDDPSIAAMLKARGVSIIDGDEEDEF